MGDSVAWGHEYFTMDDKLSPVVTETFVRLYERGPDLPRQAPGQLGPGAEVGGVATWRSRARRKTASSGTSAIPLADGSGDVVVATTRPETMLGDVAVMVHPDDERYAALVGRHVTLPLCGRDIPVIADAYVDRAFGTGVVKVTPAHDPNDYAVGQRHGLPMIGVLTLDATINDNAPEAYRGLDRFVARKTVVADLRGAGPAGGGEETPADRAALRPHRPDRRADAHRPVVRGHHQGRRRRQEHRAKGDRRGRLGRGAVSCPSSGSTPTTSG